MKVGLYSITYLGLWYRGEALTLPEMIQKAREFGYDGIEIDGKRPHGKPRRLGTGRAIHGPPQLERRRRGPKTSLMFCSVIFAPLWLGKITVCLTISRHTQARGVSPPKRPLSGQTHLNCCNTLKINTRIDLNRRQWS